MKRKIFMSLLGLSLLALFSRTSVQAQVVGEVEARIPFSFYAGDAKLPAGRYFVKALGDSNLSVMEITSANGRTSALFGIRDSEADKRPSKTELIFDKYGKSYYLAKVFEQGDKYGSAVEGSRYETRAAKGESKTGTRTVLCRRRSG